MTATMSIKLTTVYYHHRFLALRNILFPLYNRYLSANRSFGFVSGECFGRDVPQFWNIYGGSLTETSGFNK